jgi:hypothetical protein
MKKYLRICAVFCVVAILCLFAADSVYAETIIGKETYGTDRIWDSAGSPYILTKTVTVAPGATLTIKEGVQVISSTTRFTTSGIAVNGGKLFIKGKGDSRVSIKGVNNISIVDAYVEILNADVHGGTGMTLANSRVRIATSTFTGAVQAIRSKESILSIEGSHIKNNSNGIRVVPPSIVLVSEKLLPETGGLGNVLDGPIPVAQPSVSITNSSIANNTSIALGNFSSYGVQASNNWWGTAGPLLVGANRITGDVTFEPVLTEEPPLDPGTEESECCSSILFIPGFQGTRLYSGSDTVWEPHNNGDVEELFLDESGKSINNIVAGSAIDKAYGLVNIYDSFKLFLESLVRDGVVREWNVFGYDWRLPVAEVVAGTMRATTSESLMDAVEELASRSRTGKVTIVAHSNGGLVTKYLIQKLAEAGKEALIDTVVSVAVPFLGTPEAILGLLHGDNQEIVKGLIQKSSTAREFGKNMPGVYGLIPSMEYFKHMVAPTITFASSTVVGINDGSYPMEINSHAGQSGFLLDAKGVREEADISDTVQPLTANALVLGVGNSLHETIDEYRWPPTINNFSIVGWNLPTATGVQYADKNKCITTMYRLQCEKVLTHIPQIGLMGDATVVVPSSAYDADTLISLDLKQLSTIDTDGLRHSTIMEAPTTQALIRKIITDPAISNITDLPPGVSIGLPSGTGARTLVVSTHSPVELHVYDSEGNHTGPVMTAESSSVEFARAHETEIPGSEYREIGNASDPESYVYIPEPGAGKYTAVVKGVGFGLAELDIEMLEEGADSQKVTYEYIPVTPLTVISATMSAATSSVTIDADGNGTADATLVPGSAYDPLFDIKLTRIIARTLLGENARADYIDKKLSKIADQISKGKVTQAIGVALKIEKKLGHVEASRLSESDRELIVGAIEHMIAQFE